MFKDIICLFPEVLEGPFGHAVGVFVASESVKPVGGGSLSGDVVLLGGFMSCCVIVCCPAEVVAVLLWGVN